MEGPRRHSISSAASPMSRPESRMETGPSMDEWLKDLEHEEHGLLARIQSPRFEQAKQLSARKQAGIAEELDDPVKSSPEADSTRELFQDLMEKEAQARLAAESQLDALSKEMKAKDKEARRLAVTASTFRQCLMSAVHSSTSETSWGAYDAISSFTNSQFMMSKETTTWDEVPVSDGHLGDDEVGLSPEDSVLLKKYNKVLTKSRQSYIDSKKLEDAPIERARLLQELSDANIALEGKESDLQQTVRKCQELTSRLAEETEEHARRMEALRAEYRDLVTTKDLQIKQLGTRVNELQESLKIESQHHDERLLAGSEEIETLKRKYYELLEMANEKEEGVQYRMTTATGQEALQSGPGGVDERFSSLQEYCLQLESKIKEKNNDFAELQEVSAQKELELKALIDFLETQTRDMDSAEQPKASLPQKVPEGAITVHGVPVESDDELHSYVKELFADVNNGAQAPEEMPLVDCLKCTIEGMEARHLDEIDSLREQINTMRREASEENAPQHAQHAKASRAADGDSPVHAAERQPSESECEEASQKVMQENQHLESALAARAAEVDSLRQQCERSALESTALRRSLEEQNQKFTEAARAHSEALEELRREHGSHTTESAARKKSLDQQIQELDAKCYSLQADLNAANVRLTLAANEKTRLQEQHDKLAGELRFNENTGPLKARIAELETERAALLDCNEEYSIKHNAEKLLWTSELKKLKEKDEKNMKTLNQLGCDVTELRSENSILRSTIDQHKVSYQRLQAEWNLSQNQRNAELLQKLSAQEQLHTLEQTMNERHKEYEAMVQTLKEQMQGGHANAELLRSLNGALRVSAGMEVRGPSDVEVLLDRILAWKSASDNGSVGSPKKVTSEDVIRKLREDLQRCENEIRGVLERGQGKAVSGSGYRAVYRK